MHGRPIRVQLPPAGSPNPSTQTTTPASTPSTSTTAGTSSNNTITAGVRIGSPNQCLPTTKPNNPPSPASAAQKLAPDSPATVKPKAPDMALPQGQANITPRKPITSEAPAPLSRTPLSTVSASTSTISVGATANATLSQSKCTAPGAVPGPAPSVASTTRSAQSNLVGNSTGLSQKQPPAASGDFSGQGLVGLFSNSSPGTGLFGTKGGNTSDPSQLAAPTTSGQSSRPFFSFDTSPGQTKSIFASANVSSGSGGLFGSGNSSKQSAFGISSTSPTVTVESSPYAYQGGKSPWAGVDKPPSGGLFGNTQSNSSSGSGAFKCFSSTQPPVAKGLFGSAQPSTSDGSGLFGSKVKSGGTSCAFITVS